MTARTALERELFGLTAGTSRAQLEARVPPASWTWDEARQTLFGRPAALDHMQIAYELVSTGLRAVRMSMGCEAPWERFEQLDAELRARLPGFAFHEAGHVPWSLAGARARLEGKGNERFKAAAMLTAELPEGQMIGKAFAWRVGQRQRYGFELTWLPAAPRA